MSVGLDVSLLSVKAKVVALLKRGAALEWAFVFGLALPLFVTTIVLRAIRVVNRDAEMEALKWVDVFKSDVFFGFGFIALGFALLYATRNKKLRFPTFLFIQFLTVTIVLIEVVAFNFFNRTGSTLDFQLIYFTLSQLVMTFDVVASEVPQYIWWMMIAAVPLGLFIPWGFALGWERFVRRKLDAPPAPPVPRFKLLKWAAIGVLAIVVAFQKPFAEQNTAFARNATLTVAKSAMWSLQELLEDDVKPVTDTIDATLVATEQTQKRNVVVILLESTRAYSVSLHKPELKTTPHLVELAKKSLVADRAYAVVPHTSKALVATLCGIEPRLHVPITEARADGIPGRCLAALLADQGYETAFFQSATQRFENRRQLTENMGYETFMPLERLPKKGFEKVNYFGNEDDIMLEPSGKWIDKVKKEPFFLTYLTLTPHHDYLAPRRYGRHDFHEDDEINRYMNTIHYVDAFVNNVIELFKKKGVYENTIFVILGDHGEGFGEHGRRQHDNVIWEEGIRVPLLVHDPQRFQQGKRLQYGVNQLDVVPTVADMLGFEIENATFPGMSMLEVNSERTLRAHCWYERRCMASVRGYEKFIYHFDQRPDQFFDLARDPLEKTNIVDKIPDAERRRSDLVGWRSRVNSMYRQHAEGQLRKFVFDTEPELAHKFDNARFGEFVRLVGLESPEGPVEAGRTITVTFVFEVLAKPPAEWKLFLHGESKGSKLKNLDHQPVDGLYPLEDWHVGDFIRDEVRFRIPRGAREEYTLWLGFYHPDDGRAEVHGIEADDKRRARAVTLKLAPKEKKTPKKPTKPLQKLKPQPKKLTPKKIAPK